MHFISRVDQNTTERARFIQRSMDYGATVVNGNILDSEHSGIRAGLAIRRGS